MKSAYPQLGNLTSDSILNEVDPSEILSAEGDKFEAFSFPSYGDCQVKVPGIATPFFDVGLIFKSSVVCFDIAP